MVMCFCTVTATLGSHSCTLNECIVSTFGIMCAISNSDSRTGGRLGNHEQRRTCRKREHRKKGLRKQEVKIADRQTNAKKGTRKENKKRAIQEKKERK